MPSRKRVRRPAVELSQEELAERNTRRRLNASARAARHADRENGLIARCRVDILDQAQHVLAVDSVHVSVWHRQPQTTRQDSTNRPFKDITNRQGQVRQTDLQSDRPAGQTSGAGLTSLFGEFGTFGAVR